MNNLILVTGNRNYSDSSLRPWLLLQEFGVDFEEVSIELYRDDSAEKIAMYSPSLQVPVLIHDDIKVWDSLAICEYISESFLEDRGWPGQARRKAAARSITNELHSDFQRFKTEWPMNCRFFGRQKPSPALEQEIARLDSIIYCCRRKYGEGGDYLFGRFSIADCLIAPFAIALRSYDAELTANSRRYLQTLFENSHLQWWMEQARCEVEVLELEKTA